jgi:hypothetical protein
VAGAAAGVDPVEHQDATVVCRDPQNQGAGDIRVVGGDRRDKRAAAEGGQRDGVVEVGVLDDRRDRAEGLDLMHGRTLGIIESHQQRPDEGAARVGTGRGIRRPHHDVASALDQTGDAGEHLAALIEAGERAHGHAVGARVADPDPALHPLGHGLDDLVPSTGRHDQPADARALLAGLAGHLGDGGGDEGVELGRALGGVRSQDRRVEGVGFAGEPDPALDNIRVRLEAAGGSGGAREGDEVPVVEVVDQVAGAAGDQLQGADGQDPGGDDGAHDRLGEVAGG